MSFHSSNVILYPIIKMISKITLIMSIVYVTFAVYFKAKIINSATLNLTDLNVLQMVIYVRKMDLKHDNASNSRIWFSKWLLPYHFQIKMQMKKISTADHLVAKLVRDPQTDLHKLLNMAKRHYEEIDKLVKAPHHAITMAENRLYYVLLAIFASKTNIHYMV